jgi:hypothetical protein
MNSELRKPLVYVAGPITKPVPMHNAHKACMLGSELIRDGLVIPFIPQAGLLWDCVAPLEYEEWMEYDFGIIRNSDALFRMPGESPGADREVDFAEQLGIPVFYNMEAMYMWVVQTFRSKPQKR